MINELIETISDKIATNVTGGAGKSTSGIAPGTESSSCVKVLNHEGSNPHGFYPQNKSNNNRVLVKQCLSRNSNENIFLNEIRTQIFKFLKVARKSHRSE